MRKLLPLIFAATLPAMNAMAEQKAVPKSVDYTKPGKLLPLKGSGSANACAAFGPGFVKVEGTNTCTRVGGYISNGASAYMGAR